MHCYNHPDKEAVGMCKVCGRAVCRACSSMNGVALICNDPNCNKMGDYQAQMMARIPRMMQARKITKIMSLVMIGLLAIAVGIMIFVGKK